jgi:hypothetical protein
MKGVSQGPGLHHDRALGVIVTIPARPVAEV